MDFIDIFTPTIKFDTLRLFLVIVILENLEYYYVDVNNIFIESFLNEVIYINAPASVNLPSG